MPTSTQKNLSNLLKRIFPTAKRSYHPLGVVLRKPNETPQLICCLKGIERPFHVTFQLIHWQAMFDAAAKLGAELSYATPGEPGTTALVLPLHSVDQRHPDWRTSVQANVYDEETEDFISAEVVNFPRAVGNRVSLPESKWSEYELQCACIAWVRAERPDLVVWSNATEACYKKWRHYELSGVTRGTPDLTCVLPGGRVLLVELKRPSGVLSEAQMELGARITGCGVGYHVVRSVGQFQALLAA